MEEQTIKVGITHGDINGIGYEVILKTFSDTRMTELCIPVLYGSSKIVAYHRKALELAPLNISAIGKAEEAGSNRVNIINCVKDDTKVELSKPTAIANEAAFKALETAAGDLKRGAIDVLVTAPANNCFVGTNKYPTHTEYLEQTFGNGKHKALPVLVYGALRVALVTGDIFFSEVLPQITKARISETLSLFYHTLKQDFNIVRPRIALLSLNPHPNRMSGKEEASMLIPAMQEAEKQGIISFGPYAADHLFGALTYNKFDGILAMYYDQGITPFRTLVANNGFNYTAGLSVVRTSPVHGAAHEIAGQNIASEDSFRQAVYAAMDICRNRRIYKEAVHNPLRKQYFEKGSVDENIDLTKDDTAVQL
ncbi:MAG: 4-hydroxythreonine-4-phosphate dehydrogenase PdxA [Tannerellaceae bacterium]|jgi:4-hydroxythreonine-4-phosphate dehydrogenase|nr:4-hydroxythreonine-4-phosphate dehydrogenase PdxA [Tannerellaceae bacterium]